jgi:hypothetical protein
MSYSNTLPAPGTLINAAGAADVNGLPAPGFKGLDFDSVYPVGISRTRSNRGLPNSGGEHYWTFTISYNEMTKEEFEAVNSFLMGHNTRLNPFYVVLPNYAAPEDSAFATYAAGNTITAPDAQYAGDTTVEIVAPEGLKPGCFINFVDSDDALHKSTYRVARVESPSQHAGVAPAAGRLRLTIFPPLQRDFSGTVTVRFTNPTFRVIQRNSISPKFDNNNIVDSFSLQVEEILP